MDSASGCSLEFIAVLGLTSGLEGDEEPISIPPFAGGGLVSGRGRTPIAEAPAGDSLPAESCLSRSISPSTSYRHSKITT